MILLKDLNNWENRYVVSIKSKEEHSKAVSLGFDTCKSFEGDHYYSKDGYWLTSVASTGYKGEMHKDCIIIELSEIEGFCEDNKVDMKYLIKILKKYNIR